MREQTYQLIVSYIRNYALGMEVKETNERQYVLNVVHGQRILVPVPCLTLKSRRSYGNDAGSCWRIPRPDLNAAIRNISSQDPGFHDRVKRNALAKVDVEKIILVASHNVIRLTLYDGTLPIGFGR